MMRQSSKSSRHLGRAGLGWKATVTSCYRWKVSTSARKNMSVNCFGKLAKGDNTASAFDCSLRGPPIIDWEPSLMSEIWYCQQSPPCFWTLALSQHCGRHVEMLLVQLNVCIRPRVSRRDHADTPLFPHCPELGTCAAPPPLELETNLREVWNCLLALLCWCHWCVNLKSTYHLLWVG